MAVVLASLVATAGSARAGDWSKESDKEGLAIWSRAVAGSSVKEFRAAAAVEAPIEVVYAVLRDLDAYGELMPPTESARLLRRDGSAAWYHMVIRPSFISRRDYCIRSTASIEPGGRRVVSWVADDAGCPPVRADLVRMATNSGSWVLTPSATPGRTDVVYQAHSDPGGRVPGWMVNYGTARGLVDVFRALRRAATLPRYAGAAR